MVIMMAMMIMCKANAISALALRDSTMLHGARVFNANVFIVIIFIINNVVIIIITMLHGARVFDANVFIVMMRMTNMLLIMMLNIVMVNYGIDGDGYIVGESDGDGYES